MSRYANAPVQRSTCPWGALFAMMVAIHFKIIFIYIYIRVSGTVGVRVDAGEHQSFSFEVTQRMYPTLTLCNLRKQTAAVRR